MSGGGGKGGSSKQTVELPEWYSDAAKQALALGEATAKRGYVPDYSPVAAAFTDQQTDAMQGANDFASAFGMAPSRDIASEIPQAQEFAGGIKGYSSIPLFEQAMAAYREANPGQDTYSKQFYIDPVTGKLPDPNFWDTYSLSELEKKRLGPAASTTKDRTHGGGEGPRDRTGQTRSDYRSPGTPSLW